MADEVSVGVQQEADRTLDEAGTGAALRVVVHPLALGAWSGGSAVQATDAPGHSKQ